MIFGAHMIVYSKDPTADRAFFRDVLGLSSVDAGDGWLIFALPPRGGLSTGSRRCGERVYLMWVDLKAEMQALESKGVKCSDVVEARWVQ